MSYAPNPMEALASRARYLCVKHGVGLKGNAWNPCWRVWGELVQKVHLVWPSERVVFTLALGMEERRGVGPATVVQGRAEILYCTNTGLDAGSDVFVFEWFCPLLLKLGIEGHDELWQTQRGDSNAQQEAWLRHLLNEPTLRKLSVQEPRWRRAIGQLSSDDVMECLDEATS